jgi:hypothetical protein
MNQITVEETGSRYSEAGGLLHFFTIQVQEKTASVKNKLTFRTAAGDSFLSAG